MWIKKELETKWKVHKREKERTLWELIVNFGEINHSLKMDVYKLYIQLLVACSGSNSLTTIVTEKCQLS